MVTNVINPLKVPNKLASNPTEKLKFSVDVKNKSGQIDQLADPKCTRALVSLMNQHAVIGGAAAHWGGPSAFAEIVSSVHAHMFKKEPWFKSYNFVNDAGHAENGIYALRANYGFDNLNFDDLKHFRSIESKLTGHGEAHLNPEGVFISNGPLGSGVPQAQGLALADKLLGNERTTICILSDGASMEGEAKESFAAIPGLAQKNKLNPFVLLISDNNTKLSGRINEDSFDMAPTFKSLETLGWDLRFVEDGHNIEMVHQTVESALCDAEKNHLKPIAVVFKTIKGYGVKSTEDSKSGGHGYPLGAYDEKLPSFIQEIYQGNAPDIFVKWANDILESKPEKKDSQAPKVPKGKIQPGLSNAAINAVKKGYPVVSVSSDLQGSTGIAPFHKEYPEYSFDMGVAESNMISTAIGLSKQGFIPLIDTFAQFAITKGNLPLIMSSLSQAPIIGLLSHTGFQDAADGASHQATTYVSAVANIPHTTIVSCSCSTEAEKYLEQAIEETKTKREAGEIADSYIFFFGRENFPAYYDENQSYEWLKPQVLRKGKDGLLVTTGSLVPNALAAADFLEKEGMNITVVNHPFINKIDTPLFSGLLNQNKNKLVTLEDHQVLGGMGSLLIHNLVASGENFKCQSLGIHGEFGQSAYKASELYQKHDLDETAVVEAFKNLV